MSVHLAEWPKSRHVIIDERLNDEDSTGGSRVCSLGRAARAKARQGRQPVAEVLGSCARRKRARPLERNETSSWRSSTCGHSPLLEDETAWSVTK